MSLALASTSGGRSALKVAILFATGLLASCDGAKPGGQTIAVVDGKPITQAELNVDMAGVPDATDPSRRNEALQALINRKVFVAAAHDQGLDKDPSYRLEADRQEEILLARKYLQRVTAGVSSQITDADINSFLVRHPQLGPSRKVIQVEQVQFKMPTGKQALAELEGAKTMPALLQVLQAHQVQARPSKATLDSAGLPLVMFKGLIATSSGEPLILANGESTLAQVVVGMTDAPLPSEQAQALARKALEQERLAERLNQQAQALRGSAKIEYADGYGPPKTPGTKPPK